MVRLLSLLLMFALVVTNGAAIATAMCEHVDATAHAHALQSTDTAVAARALNEETAAAVTGGKGALADAAAVQLGGVLIPSDPILPRPFDRPKSDTPATVSTKLASLEISPLLEPPLA